MDKPSNNRNDDSQPPAVVGDPSSEEKDEKPNYVDSWGNVLRGYQRALGLKGFADAGRAPLMTDVEIAVCFADLRGFTHYVHKLQRDGQDNKVQHFLRSYFKIYPEGVLKSVWSLEPDSPKEQISARNAEIKKLVVPTTYKNLGDGLMMVWELQSASSMEVQGLTTRVILDIIEEVQIRFGKITTDMSDLEVDSYSRHAAELKMGFGLARGHAWRLEFAQHTPPDYAGSIVNLAARLQDLARPSGIVAQLDFSESLFRQRVKDGKGILRDIPAPKGLGADTYQVWASETVLLPKTSGDLTT